MDSATRYSSTQKGTQLALYDFGLHTDLFSADIRMATIVIGAQWGDEVSPGFFPGYFQNTSHFPSSLYPGVLSMAGV